MTAQNKENGMTQINILEKELRHLAAFMKQNGRAILENYPITPPQFVALQWLEELGDMTIGELSSKMYLAFSTTTDLVDRMEKLKLVKRVRDKHDRRVVRIHLLSKGVRIIKEVIEKRQLYLANVVKNFERGEIEQLSILLKKLYEEMNED